MQHILIIKAFVIFVFISGALTWRCGADSKSVVPTKVDLPHGKLRTLQSTSFTPLEIYYDYTTLDKQTANSQIKDNIKTLLTEAKDLFKAIVFAKKTSSKLALGVYKCNGADVNIEISKAVQDPGVDAHLIIFPFLDFEPGGNVLAYASSCLIISDYRPIAGFIGFPISALDFTVENWISYYLSLVMHELTHVLVFSSNLFKNFVDENDKLLSTPKTKATIINGVQRTLLITPKVVKAARTHFNCSTLEGVELENQGGKGTAGSHWEARIMLTDFMIGSNYDETAISDITLALFEDSGWYKVNYYTGGLFRFGKNNACSFLNTRCIENQKSNFKNEFCNENNKAFCTNGRSSRGFCHINTHASISSEYIYFPSTKKGGFSLADYCPVSRVVSDNTKYLNWNCKYGDVDSSNQGETLSNESLCFISSLVPLNIKVSSPKAICYPYECDFNKTVFKVKVLNEEIECPSGGGTLSHASFGGSFECPEFNEVCTTETPCYDIKSCIEKKSASIASRNYASTIPEPEPDQGKTSKISMILFTMYILLLS